MPSYEVVEVQSHTNPAIWYRVDVTNNRCSCPAWKFSGSRKPCKHLKVLLAGGVIKGSRVIVLDVQEPAAVKPRAVASPQLDL